MECASRSVAGHIETKADCGFPQVSHTKAGIEMSLESLDGFKIAAGEKKCVHVESKNGYGN